MRKAVRTFRERRVRKARDHSAYGGRGGWRLKKRRACEGLLAANHKPPAAARRGSIQWRCGGPTFGGGAGPFVLYPCNLEDLVSSRSRLPRVPRM